MGACLIVDIVQLTGLDVQLSKSTLARAGIRLSYTHLDWDVHQDALKRGSNDMASGAFINDERQRYAWFSHPYRYESNVLYVRRGTRGQYPFKSSQAMLA